MQEYLVHVEYRGHLETKVKEAREECVDPSVPQVLLVNVAYLEFEVFLDQTVL